MWKYDISASIIRAIENLYDKAQSAVLFNGSTAEWFRTTVGVRQGCLLSPTLFNIFLERIMCEALDDHEDNVSIGARLITNFRFADDIVVNEEQDEEAGVLVVEQKSNDQEPIQSNSISCPKHQTGKRHLQLRRH